jgi:serine/threonine-protein kinase RsbT
MLRVPRNFAEFLHICSVDASPDIREPLEYRLGPFLLKPEGETGSREALAPRLHNIGVDFASTMYALEALQKTQPSERSRRYMGFGSTWPTIRVPIESDADIVIARQQGKAIATTLNFSATDSAFIATTVSELARALLSRTVRGEIWLHRVCEDERDGVVIVARDPVAHDGWRADRHAVGSDMKLPEVFRLVDEFDVASDTGRGTTIRATKWRRRRSRVGG